MRLFRRHRKAIKFILILLVPILSYGLVKLALWYNTKTAIENFTNQASDFVQVKYKTITSSLKGSVSINGITVFIPLVKESIHIKSIRITADNVISMLTLKYKLDSGDLPKSLSVIIEGLKVDLNSKLLNTPKETKQTNFERFSTLACGETKRFDEKALKKMGYSNIETDFNISYNYDKLAKTLNFNLYENMDRFFSLEFDLQLKNINKIPDSSAMTMAMSSASIDPNMPQLGIIKLTINDDSFIDRKVIFCAKNNNSNKKEYIKKHVAMADVYLQKLGIKLNKSLINAYQKTLSHPGNVIVSMNFSDIDNPMELSQFTLNDALSQLSTELYVNNKPITPISIQVDQNKLNLSTDAKAKEIEIDDPNVKVRLIKKYHLVNKNNLQPYNKRRVILKTIQGKTYKGQITILSSNKYEVSTRSHGGKVGYFVKKSEIKSIKVFY